MSLAGHARLATTVARLPALLALLAHGASVHAQAGPPYLTNDPGTPGDGNWEINLASMQTIARGVASYQTPQIDLNFGLGRTIQLTYEIPYVIQTSARAATTSAWGNAYPGIKWRFLDQGDGGWQMSTFPQFETAGSAPARSAGIAGSGPRFLVPFEVTKRVGSIDLDFEAGYYFPDHGSRERIFGFVAGKSLTQRLELDAEIYDDRAQDGAPRSTTFDVGGRYKLRPGIIALFMLGRSVSGFGQEQPEFMGYIGVQLLSSHFGRSFHTESE